MGNWKELGEVPDSDDEGWESEHSLQPLSPSHSQPRAQLDPERDNVWESCESPTPDPIASFTIQNTRILHPQPPSSVFANLERIAGQTTGEKQRDPPNALDLQGDSGSPNWDYGSPDPLTNVPAEAEAGANIKSPDRRDDIYSSPSIVERSESPALPFPGSTPDVANQDTSVTGNYEEGNKIQSEALVNPIAGTPPTTPFEPPARGRRSLRPRKPIQEHPYLLENAKYSNVFKSHGLKPIRIAAAEQMAAKRRSKDPQDQESTEDDSQSGGPHEESQRWLSKTNRKVLHDDMDELALSQSPRTSSPQRHLRASSEHSPGQQTDDTSVLGDEDFPDIRDLVAKRKPSTSIKRRMTTQPSSPRKRMRTKHTLLGHESPLRKQNDACDPPPSIEPVSSIPKRQNTPYPVESLRPSFELRGMSRSASPPGQLTPAPCSRPLAEPIDLTALTAEHEEESDGQKFDPLSSDSESDLIRRTGRRIRGVLPASWLRLDQQICKEKAKTAIGKQSLPRSLDWPRPGLATKRSGLSKPTMSTKSFLEDLVEGDGGDDEIPSTTEQSAHSEDQEQGRDDVSVFSLDDNASVVEDNAIDWMLPVQKGNRTSSTGPARKKKTLQADLKKPKRYRQPKILRSVHGLDRLDRVSKRVARSRPKEIRSGQAKRDISPPALSIADVVVPGAPKFLKIAARAASKRINMGRSKPLNKRINLGTRTDNIDALSVLRDWQTGNIKPKTSKLTRPATRKATSRPREYLRTLASNARTPCRPSAGLSFKQPQRLSRQVSVDDSVSAKATAASPEVQPVKKTRLESKNTQPHDLGFGYRPAQLEADVLQGDGLVDFGVRKRLLDLIFRKGWNEVLAPTFQLLRPSTEEESQSELFEAVTRPKPSASELSQHGASIIRMHPRPRKLVPPRRLDLDAPQYRHANDPLSFFDDHPLPLMPVEEGVQPQCEGATKIIGLGPFGTHYTQHFDIFPLHGGTFFHHTTIIGDGTLKKALDYHVPQFATCNRPSLLFEFSSCQFQWGRWTDTTSSELGLLFDSIAEHVELNGDVEISSRVCQIVDAAGFVLRYVFEFASINDKSELRSFTERMLELLVGFMNNTLHSASGPRSNNVLLQITSRFLICNLILLRMCQGTVDFSSQAQQAEDILKRLARILIEMLLKIGLSDLRMAYDDLHRPLVRERGIRDDSLLVINWVMVMKVLGSAQIPKSGFWDVVSSVMTAELTGLIDAQGLERLWRGMFTLLPLTEFDDAGVLNKGMRYVAPLQGWSLPQKLLKIVFESYQANQRQSPSFNDYFRALLGRCHYLIEHWGWQRCLGIVGTIFDFFGRQNLSHLRNEEVYKSPRFLEELSEGPCLSIKPEDRSFHIFLKILAVAILGMKRRGLSNDIRNLITRCLPNHNRQFSKEQTIHSHDLASLRNHHDLLCTLFWAAPPESRRPVALIEDLVRPASSHKEACLINLRAWNQLARFVVSSGSSVQDYRPFLSWQNNVFHQLLNQYLSAAADVETQFLSMAKEDRSKIQKQFLDSVVTANQNAAKDVLYFSVTASLDVAKHCPSLMAATYSFNVSQMTKSLNKLSGKGIDLDWGLLRASFDTVDVFVSRLESVWYSFRESTGDSVSTHANREFEDAVEFLDDKIILSFIAATRRAMLSPVCATAAQPARSVVEKAIVLCGRIASLFIEGGKSSLVHFFSAGKYGLFEILPDELGPIEWRFVPLFVSTLLKNHVFNFSSLGCTHFDLWISSLVKPFHVLRYDFDLAATLKALDIGYMKGTAISTRTALDYGKKRDLFASAISYIRKEVRQADLAQRRPTKAKYEKTLNRVMRQIRSSIQSLQLNSTEHSNYIGFIRDIVGLIKSHGADICSVDPYFYQVSAEYSPPKEDPQLHAAGIHAYGIRLGEGEATAIPQLFSYLYNHFKTSMASDRLDAESKIIENGMQDDSVLAFIIGRMLPAIIQASSYSSDIWPLLDIYAEALYKCLTRSYLPREIPEHAVDDVVALLTTILTWAQNLRGRCTEFTPAQAHIFTQLLTVCNAMRPWLACWLLRSSATVSRLRGCVMGICRLAKQAAAVLGELSVAGGSGGAIRSISVKDLILADIQLIPMSFDHHIQSFAQNLLRDVQSNWVVTSDILTVRVAATPSSQRAAGAAQGVKNDLHSRAGLLSELLAGLKVWLSEMGEGEEESSQRRRRRGPRRTPLRLSAEF